MVTSGAVRLGGDSGNMVRSGSSFSYEEKSKDKLCIITPRSVRGSTSRSTHITKFYTRSLSAEDGGCFQPPKKQLVSSADPTKAAQTCGLKATSGAVLGYASRWSKHSKHSKESDGSMKEAAQLIEQSSLPRLAKVRGVIGEAADRHNDDDDAAGAWTNATGGGCLSVAFFTSKLFVFHLSFSVKSAPSLKPSTLKKFEPELLRQCQ